MGKPYGLELRERVVSFVDAGNSHRAAARHFSVSPRFVNNMIKLRRDTNSLLAKEQGHHGYWNKVNAYTDWVRQRLADKPDLTLVEIRQELEEAHGLRVGVTTVWDWLQRLGLSHKKNTSCR